MLVSRASALFLPVAPDPADQTNTARWHLFPIAVKAAAVGRTAIRLIKP
jgi:hypothetical protein